jgi:anaerobic dimethyl sulfoxide reductase subunit C
MGWGEWPLMIFTVTAQAATGAFWWCCVALLAGGLPPDQVAQLERLMVVIWAMIVAAFAAAAFHLGSPLRGINASFRFGRSAFSNEVVFGSAFVGLGFLGWLMSTFGVGSASVQIVVLALALLCSFAFLASMTAFYMMPTVPTWNTPLTPAAYVLTTIIGGSTVAAPIFAAAGITQPAFLLNGPVAVVCVALVAAMAVTLLQSALLARIHSSIREASALSPHYGALMSLRFVILFSALGLWLLDLLGSEPVSVGTGISCIILVMIGEMVGRGVHYGLHMTVGLR